MSLSIVRLSIIQSSQLPRLETFARQTHRRPVAIGGSRAWVGASRMPFSKSSTPSSPAARDHGSPRGQRKANIVGQPDDMSITGTSDPESAADLEIAAGLEHDPPVPEAPPESVQSQQFIDCLSSDGRIGMIIGPDRSGKTVLLNTVAAAFDGPVFKVANPLFTPLSLTRILVQVDALDDGGEDAALLRAHLAMHATPGRPAMLAVDDAHTLDDAAFTALADLASPATDGTRVHLLLAGRPELETRAASLGLGAFDPERVFVVALQGPISAPYAVREQRRLPSGTVLPAMPLPPPPLKAPVRAPAPAPVLELVASDPVAMPARPLPPIREDDAPASPQTARRGSRVKRPRLLALVVITALISVVTIIAGRRDPAAITVTAPPNPASVRTTAERPPATITKPPPALVGPAQPLPDPAPEPPPAVVLATPVPVPDQADSFKPGSVSKSEDQLRREFQAFLTRTGRYGLTTDPTAFEALFQRYQQWRLRAKPGGAFVVPR